MNLPAHTTLGIDLSQQWLTYESVDQPSQKQTFYNFMLHYQWQPVTRISFSTEAGYRRQRGFGFDQDLFAVRTYLNWTIAKLEMHFGYEHEYQELTHDKNERDFGFVRLKRSF